MPQLAKNDFPHKALVKSEWYGLVDRAKSIKFDELSRLLWAAFCYHIYMRYNIVAGEELKKILTGVIDNPIPFNEDMSIGSYINEPFSESFIKERSQAHNVTASLYKEKLSSFLSMINNLTKEDEIHLYFGEDEVCLVNRGLLIKYFTNKVKKITLHIVDEYTGKEIKVYENN